MCRWWIRRDTVFALMSKIMQQAGPAGAIDKTALQSAVCGQQSAHGGDGQLVRGQPNANNAN
jgi:hypothetical protein